MQTPKTRAAALEVPQRTQKTARQLKTSGTETDNSSSLNPVAKTLIARSPKVVDRRSPRTPTSEKKRTGRVSELEAQLTNLQEELKIAKDQFSQSESQKKLAHEEAEDAKKQLAELTVKLQDSLHQLNEISASEESRLQELVKVSQDRDRAWESELDAVKNHHSMDSAALAAAVNEVQKLMTQLEKATESEANHAKYAESVHDDMLKLKLELSETLDVVKELKIQLKDSQDSEARALVAISQTRKQLEIVDSEKLEAMKSCESLTVELEKSKAKVDSLEEIVSKLEIKNSKFAGDANDKDTDDQEEINCVKMEVEKLKEELEKAYELVEQRTVTSQKVSVLEAKLKDMKANLENITEENKNLHEKMKKTELATEKDTEYVKSLKKLEADLEDLKRIKFENEKELKYMTVELEKLKMEKNEVNNEAGRLAEIEAFMKVKRVTEELDLAQVANAEMEAELRRLRVQTDQWRKAAEAAAAMISGGTNGKFVERTGSLDTHTIGGKLHSSLLEDIEDDSPKKKNGNMLKKFGVFMKSKRGVI